MIKYTNVKQYDNLIGSKLVKVCTNTEGSFNCKTAKGFRSDALSISDEYVDIDECTEGGHLCDINAYCYNVPGKSSKSSSIFNLSYNNRKTILRVHSLELLISKRIYPYYDSQDPLDVESANLGLNQLVLNATSACAKI